MKQRGSDLMLIGLRGTVQLAWLVQLALFVLLTLGSAMVPARVSADPMDITLSRLRLSTSDPSVYTPDVAAYRSLMTQLSGALAPSSLRPARTLGMRQFHVQLFSVVSPIASNARYWQLGTRGDDGSDVTRGHRFVDGSLSQLVGALHKGLPLGFELGIEFGGVLKSDLLLWGASLTWAVLEGFHDGALGYVPDMAFRFSMRTVVGNAHVRLRLPSLAWVLSKPITVRGAAVLTPMASVQMLWSRASTHRVDLTPDVDALALCQPVPSTPSTPSMTSATSGVQCMGSDVDFANDVVFPRARSRRLRASAGLHARYKMLSVAGALSVDLVKPHQLNSNVSLDVPRQWATQLGVGLVY